MRYLFFDIECCDGEHICEFGYVLTDDQFNIIDKTNIPMNPEARFNLTGRSHRPDINLYHSEEYYFRCPKFTKYYNDIKNLLEYKDQIIVGYAISNDAGFINTACEKYELTPINFRFFDSQKIYKECFETSNDISLEDAGKYLHVDFPKYLHKSDDDSELAMKLTQRMCEELETTLPELIDLYPSCCGKAENFDVYYVDTKAKEDKLFFAAKTKPDNLSTKAKDSYLKNFLKTVKRTENLPDLFHGNSICISHNYEITHFNQTLFLIQMIVNHGGKYTAKSSKCNIFVTYPLFDENGDKIPCPRLNSVKAANVNGNDIRIINLDEFLTMLEITETDLNANQLPIELSYKQSKTMEHRKPQQTNASIGEMLNFKLSQKN